MVSPALFRVNTHPAAAKDLASCGSCRQAFRSLESSLRFLLLALMLVVRPSVEMLSASCCTARAAATQGRQSLMEP